MRKTRGGFTIIEVVLFVAISGFLIVGLMVGTSATIARQRYNDSVQDLAEYFRREYSAVINPENGRTGAIDDNQTCLGPDEASPVGGTNADVEGANRGRSACLLYGRLITIGEVDDDEGRRIYSYDVIGKELSQENIDSAGSLKDALVQANIKVLVYSEPEQTTSATCSFEAVGQYQYTPQWLAKVENPADDKALKASILIIRSPANGSVHTLVYDEAIKVKDTIGIACTSSMAGALLDEETIAKFTASLNEETPKTAIDLCVGSSDIFVGGSSRRSVRIGRDGHNGSAVEIADEDSEDNPCQQ